MLGIVRNNTHARRAGGLLILVFILLYIDGMELSEVFPIMTILAAGAVYRSLNHEYSVSQGYKSLILGSGFIIAGSYMFIIQMSWVGVLTVSVGVWFIFDGIVAIQYDTRERTNYLSSGNKNGIDETMLRIYTASAVYNDLSDAKEPQAATDIATSLDLTESRVNMALLFLENKGHIEKVDDGYRPIVGRWGVMTPIVRFAVWLPKRIARPFIQIFRK
jgi:hypothetical protein